MKRFAKEDKNAYLIDMSDAELMGDRLHFNQNSAEYLGKVPQSLSKMLQNKQTWFLRICATPPISSGSP